jgi:hypothetical protein
MRRIRGGYIVGPHDRCVSLPFGLLPNQHEPQGGAHHGAVTVEAVPHTIGWFAETRTITQP